MFARLIIVGLLLSIVYAQRETNGAWVATDGNEVIAGIQDSGQLWVYDLVAPAPCASRSSLNGGTGLLLADSDIQGTPDSPACFDVMSQGNPRDAWGVSGIVSGTTPIVGYNDLVFSVNGNLPNENDDIEFNVNVQPFTGGNGVQPYVSTVDVNDPATTGPQIEVVHSCYSLTGVTQIIICDVSVTNLLAVDIDDVRYRKSTDYDPRGGVTNTITILNPQMLGESIGIEDSPYSYEDPNPFNPLADQRSCLDSEGGCGPEQLGVTFEIPIGTLTSGQTYRFQMYYGAAPDRADLLSTTIGLRAIPSNIAFYGESFSRAFVTEFNLTNCAGATTASPCFDADSWLLGVGYPFTDCGCWALWECPTGASPPQAPTLCSGPTEYYENPIATGASGTFTTYLVHSTTSGQAYRFLDAGCTEVGTIGQACSPATTDLRTDFVKRWYCRTPDRQCVTLASSPASSETYVVDIAPASGVTCDRCLDSDCNVPESAPPTADRDCYAYWSCTGTGVPETPTNCASPPAAYFGGNTEASGTTFGYIVHSTSAGQAYRFPASAGCTQQYVFGSACNPTVTGPLREDWDLRYPCGSNTGICTTSTSGTSGDPYYVDISPAAGPIDCTTCLDQATCTVPKTPVLEAPCTDYVLP